MLRTPEEHVHVLLRGKFEQQLNLKRRISYEKSKIFEAMKKQKSESTAIRAGLLMVFPEEDFVTGVLSTRGFKQSEVATKVLDPGLSLKVQVLFVSIRFTLAFIQPYDDDCRWKHAIVDSLDLTEERNLNPLKQPYNLTSILETMQIDFLNDRIQRDDSSKREEFFGSPYFLKIDIRCPRQRTDPKNITDETEIINMGLAASHPRVVMRLTTFDDRTLSVSRRIMIDLEGVLVYLADPNQLRGIPPDPSTSKEGYPYSIWLVPIPMDDSMTSVDVIIHSPRVGKARKQEHFMLYLDYFSSFDRQPLSVDLLDSDFKSWIPSCPKKLEVIPLPIVLLKQRLDSSSLLPSYSDILMYSPDQGHTVSFFKWTAPTGASLVCSQWNSFVVFNHVVLDDRMLLASSYGLLQIVGVTGLKKYPSLQKERTILSVCVKKITQPQLIKPGGALLILITDSGDVYQSFSLDQDGEFVFDKTSIATLNGFCTSTHANNPGYTLFDPVDALDISQSSGSFFVACRNPSAGIPDAHYYLVGVSAPPPSLSPFSTLKNDQTTGVQIPIVILGMKCKDTSAKEIYAYGKGLFFSSDGGTTWIMIQGFTSKSLQWMITSFHVSRTDDRTIAMTAVKDWTASLNTDTEVWITKWSETTAYKVYPSYEWDMSIRFLPGESTFFDDWKVALPAEQTVLGVLFDSLGTLQQIFALKIGEQWATRTIKLPYEAIIAGRNTSKVDIFLDFGTSVSTASLISECPQILVRVTDRQKAERLEYFRFLKPQTRQQDYYKDPDVATVYSAVTRTLLLYSVQSRQGNYTDTPPGPDEQISQYFANGPFPNKFEFEKLVARIDPRRILILQEDYQDVVLDDRNVVFQDFPSMIYVDRAQSVFINVSLYGVTPSGSFGYDNVDGFPKVYFRLSSGSLLTGMTSVTYDPENSAVLYTIQLQELGSLKQQIPGTPLVTDSLSISIPQPLDCYPNKVSYDTTINIGCPPSIQLQYDWKMLSQQSANKRSFFDCTDPYDKMPCIDFTANVQIFLRLMDHVTNIASNFTGQYRLFVVGFGVGSPNNIRRFDENLIALLNTEMPDMENLDRIIWSPANNESPNISDPSYRILDNNHNKIQFTCQPQSPCGDPSISLFEEPHLNFLIHVTNENLMANDTYCLFDLEFIIRIRGHAPNPYTVNIPVFLGTLLVLLLLSAVYVWLYFWRVQLAIVYKEHKRKELEAMGSGISTESLRSKLSQKSPSTSAKVIFTPNK